MNSNDSPQIVPPAGDLGLALAQEELRSEYTKLPSLGVRFRRVSWASEADSHSPRDGRTSGSSVDLEPSAPAFKQEAGSGKPINTTVLSTRRKDSKIWWMRYREKTAAGGLNRRRPRLAGARHHCENAFSPRQQHVRYCRKASNFV